MSGLRQITKPLGLIEATPPEAVLRGAAPRLLRRVPPERRPIELVHNAYGIAGGVVFGTLPRPVRRRPWAGPTYGLLIWASERGPPPERAARVGDRSLFGLSAG
ncbi:hypothetical protein [Micromonospora zhanjiangensis]